MGFDLNYILKKWQKHKLDMFFFDIFFKPNLLAEKLHLKNQVFLKHYF